MGCSDDAPVTPADDDAKAKVAESTESAAEPVAVETTESEPASDLPDSDDLDQLFEALAGGGLRDLESARELTGEGSVARVYLEYLLSQANALLDAGMPGAEALESERTDDGYEGCEPYAGDDAVCVEWTEIEGADGVVVNFSINGQPIDELLVAGNGTVIEAGNQGTFELLYAYQSPVSGNFFVALSAASASSGMDVTGLYSATYRDPSGRQLGMLDATTPSELGADSTATVFISFPAPATIGGTINFDLYDLDDYSATTVTIPTA